MRLTYVLLTLLVVAATTWLLSCATPDTADSESAPAADSAPAESAETTDTTDPVDPTDPVLRCAEEPYVERPDAAKDSFTSPTNFLSCSEGKYALCYYSGADPLPCTLAESTADCQCQLFEASQDDPMYVEIGGILNRCVYEQTVEQCGEDGSLCRNLCDERPDAPGCAGEPVGGPQAVACAYIAQGTFNPAATLISTFSFAQVVVPETGEAFKLGSHDEQGRYAGCMTAPCTGEVSGQHGTYTTCACPLWPPEGTADYQFGRRCHPDEPNPLSPFYCDLKEGQVWSAAVNEAITSAAAEAAAE